MLITLILSIQLLLLFFYFFNCIYLNCYVNNMALFLSTHINQLELLLIFSTITLAFYFCFQYASDYLTPHLKNTDSLLRLHAYWAHLELNLGKNLVAAREVWEALIKNWFVYFICEARPTKQFAYFFFKFLYDMYGLLFSGSMLEAWLRYISMEKELGNIKEARSLYKRCYSKRFPETGSVVHLLFHILGINSDFIHVLSLPVNMLNQYL